MKRFGMKKLTIFFFFSLLLCIVVSVMIGSHNISFFNVLKTLVGQGERLENFTIFELRLPRILLAVVVGAALSSSGAILQTITKNPLAESGMIGINAGAALFVVLWISMGSKFYYSSMSFSTTLLIPVMAVLGSLSATLFIYFFAYKKGLNPIRFILTGVGVNATINGIISFYQLAMSKGDYSKVLTWTSGSLWGSNWNYIIFISPVIFILIAIAIYKSRTLDVLALSEEISIGVGVNAKKETAVFLLLAALLAAMATSVAGNIAFLGLVAPQIAKKIVLPFHKYSIVISCFIGAILLVIADLIARNLFSPIEIPVGIIVSILGVPYFIFLILKKG